MTKPEIEAYLYENIPVTRSLGVKAVEFSREKVRFSAPLEENINHRSTAFGGSISSLLITTGWSYLRLLFDGEDPIPKIVISRSSTDYLEPIDFDFTSELIIPKEKDMEEFKEMYRRFGKARITLKSHIQKDDVVHAVFEGDYVVMKI